MSCVLITGANRGIGLELTKQYLESGWQVHATCRSPEQAGALQRLEPSKHLSLHQMDVTRPSEIAYIADRIADIPLDLIINNAGISDYGGEAVPGSNSTIAEVDFTMWEACLQVNLLGPARVTGAFLAHLKAAQSAKVIMISSGLASIGARKLAGLYAYRSSKAALNMLMSGLAEELRSSNITLASLAPGWTHTDMGGQHAHLEVEPVVEAMRAVIDTLSLEQSGAFLSFDGRSLDW